MTKHNQFTFFRSFWDAVSVLAPADQLALLCAIIKYALYEIEPGELPLHCQAMIPLILPIVDSSRRRAEASGREASQSQANSKQKSSKGETEIENEIENEIESESEIELEADAALQPNTSTILYNILWDNYPEHRRTKRRQAIIAWDSLTYAQQKTAAENCNTLTHIGYWTKDSDKYIPHIADYLNPANGYLIALPQALRKTHPTADWVDVERQVLIYRMLNQGTQQ